jgi:hypothetical protein
MPQISAGRTRGVRWVLTQVLIVVVGIVVYFGVRGLTAGAPDLARRNALDIVEVEKALGIYVEPFAQSIADPHGLAGTLANWVYIWGHWPVIALTMVWLSARHSEHFLRLRNAMLISGGIGLLVYATYPVAPPRLAGLGLVDTVSERSHAYRILQPPAFVNQYAAMPSLHVGWDMLVGMVIVSAAGTASLRMVGRVLPLLMIVAVVVTANHYVLDVVGGLALAMVGLAGALLLERLAPRAGARATAPPQVPGPRHAPERGAAELDPCAAGSSRSPR